MTNEELVRRCVWFDVDYQDALRRGEPLRPVVEGFARALLLQAYEEAAAAECEGCRQGWPYIPAQMRHEGPGTSRPQCDAWRVRALIVSLSPVSS